jgi:hypothetical protein
MTRLVAIALLVVVGFLNTACAGVPVSILGGGADTETCVDAWNRGTQDGKPAETPTPAGQVGESGASNGFFARRVAVSATADGMGCSVTFDLGRSTFTYSSGSTGWDPRPRPDISGWLPAQDVRPLRGPSALKPAPRWNACQEDDGTLTRRLDACLERPPLAPPGRVAELLEERAWIALTSNTRGSDLGDGRTAFWLGRRFRGAVAEPGVPVPAGASVQVTYFVPDGDHLDYVQVLSYNRRLHAVPCLGDDVQCANGLRVDAVLLAKLDTRLQSILVIEASGATVSPAIRRRIRHALQPASATSPHPDVCAGRPDFDCGVIGVGAEREPVVPPVSPPPGADGGYWLGPDFQGPPLADPMALPGTVAYLYTLMDYRTSVRVVTTSPGRLKACIRSRYCSQSVYTGIRRTPVIARVRRGVSWVVLIQDGGGPLPAWLVRRMVRAIQPA